MTEVLKREQAAASIRLLLDALKVRKVVCVDDLYGRPTSLEDVQAAQLCLSGAEVSEIVGAPETPFPDDVVVRRQRFRDIWARLDATEQQQLAKRILRAADRKDPGLQAQVEVADSLMALIGADRFEPVAPANWETYRRELLASAGEERTLLLFDQDLSMAGGSATGGIELVKNLIAEDKAGQKAICGLFTHTVTPKNQVSEWQRLALANGMDRSRFVVVAKAWLGEDPSAFARMLKLIALSPDCEKMMERVKSVLHEAADDAFSRIKDVTIYDFDDIVLQSSYEEGIWEPDMLFRVFGIFQRTAVRERAHADGELSRLAERLRSVSHIPTNSSSAPTATSWRIQQQDTYDPGEHINQLHLPIEIGDIFAKTDGQSMKYYLLLGQPCELMVRSDGRRHPESTDVLLAEIAPRAADKEHSQPMPYFGDDPAQEYCAMLRRTHTVNPCVLDLCVFNSDGTSKIVLEADLPEGLLPAWIQRYRVLQKWTESILRRYGTAGGNEVTGARTPGDARERILKQLPLVSSNSHLFRASLTFDGAERGLAFNCRRVKRLFRPRAAAIALRYAESFSRPAFDRDLGGRCRGSD